MEPIVVPKNHFHAKEQQTIALIKILKAKGFVEGEYKKPFRMFCNGGDEVKVNVIGAEIIYNGTVSFKGNHYADSIEYFKCLNIASAKNEAVDALLVTIKAIEARFDNAKELLLVNVADCKIYKDNEVWVVEYNDKVLYYEVHSASYPYFQDALHMMDVNLKAKWKTVKNLVAFRQAIREDTVNCRGLCDMLEHRVTKNTFDAFMNASRAADLHHHGQHTF